MSSRVHNYEQLVLSNHHNQSLKNPVLSENDDSMQVSQASYPNHETFHRIISELADHLVATVCSLSTLHKHVTHKVAIMYALYNKQSNHVYFFDQNPIHDLTALNVENGASLEEESVEVISVANDGSRVVVDTVKAEQDDYEFISDDGKIRSLAVRLILRKVSSEYLFKITVCNLYDFRSTNS